MVRPREFDRDVALQKATEVFWARGFAGTSTEDLLTAMGIGRQSLYNAFGDKRKLYLESLRVYQENSTSGHLARLKAAESPLDGIRDMLVGLAPDDDAVRALGCMGVGAVGEFGTTDPELCDMRKKVSPALAKRLVERIREGQAKGEIETRLDARLAAAFIQTTMSGMQVAARGGASVSDLRAIATFTVDRLRAS
jgi:AcrR family transcriptional regulator